MHAPVACERVTRILSEKVKARAATSMVSSFTDLFSDAFEIPKIVLLSSISMS